MNTNRNLLHALVASFAITAIPGQATETRNSSVAAADPALVELCASTQNGMVPRAQVEKALHRMLDMGETPQASKMGRDDKRKMQFDVFWKEFARTSGG